MSTRVKDALGRPGAMAIVLVLVTFWITGNYVAERAGVHTLEEAPFPELGPILTVAALLGRS